MSWLLIFCALITVGAGAYLSTHSSHYVPESTTVTIPQGYSFQKTARLLHENNIISSVFVMELKNRFHPISVKAGTYQFDAGTYTLESVFQRLLSAEYGDIYTRVTIPEGSSNAEIAEIISAVLPEFDPQEFIEISMAKEGYLFPDTYFFLPDDDADRVRQELENTFDNKTSQLQTQVPLNRTWSEIVIMASLIEKEATGNLSEKKIVSGILWKRIDEGMLLQIDAPFRYLYGQVEAADLRTPHPYNTYMNSGLTPGPIGNPGIDSLMAALFPESSSYYYYLHSNGQIYYATTYNQHVNNINRYLR